MLGFSALAGAIFDDSQNSCLDLLATAAIKVLIMPPQQAKFTKQTVRQCLVKYGSDTSAYIAENPALIGHLFDMMKEFAERDLAGAAISGFGAASEKLQGLTTSPGGKAAIRSTTAVVSIAKLSMSLRILDNAAKFPRLATPGGAIALIGATTVTKMGILLSLGGDSDRRVRCASALMELGGNATILALTWESGIGAVLGVAAVLSAALEARNACME